MWGAHTFQLVRQSQQFLQACSPKTPSWSHALMTPVAVQAIRTASLRTADISIVLALQDISGATCGPFAILCLTYASCGMTCNAVGTIQVGLRQHRAALRRVSQCSTQHNLSHGSVGDSPHNCSHAACQEQYELHKQNKSCATVPAEGHEVQLEAIPLCMASCCPSTHLQAKPPAALPQGMALLCQLHPASHHMVFPLPDID